MDIIEEKQLEKIPIPDWSEINMKYYKELPCVIPHLELWMYDQLTPSPYWAAEETNYSINPDYKLPFFNSQSDIKGERGYLSIMFSTAPACFIFIIFDADMYAPHEALFIASQKDGDHFANKTLDEFTDDECCTDVDIFLVYEDFHLINWKPEKIIVTFNDLSIQDNQAYTVKKLQTVHNTYYEYLLLHIWSCFFVNEEQKDAETEKLLYRVMLMKYQFLDKLEIIKFKTGIEAPPYDFKGFEYWIGNNGVMRIRHIGKLGVLQKSLENDEVLPGDKIALRAARIGYVEYEDARLTERQWKKLYKEIGELLIEEEEGQPKRKQTKK